MWFLAGLGLAERRSSWRSLFASLQTKKQGKKCFHGLPVLCWRASRDIQGWLPVPTELIISPIQPLAQFSRNRSPVHSTPDQKTTQALVVHKRLVSVGNHFASFVLVCCKDIYFTTYKIIHNIVHRFICNPNHVG